MVTRVRNISPPRDRFERESVEFLFDAGGPIALRELASSFTAIDDIYARVAKGEERLSVLDMRSGSIIADLAPFLPFMNQVMPYVGHVTALSDFARKIKKAIDGFTETEKPVVASEETSDIAAELAEIMKPLAGRPSAKFGFAHVKYRSKSAKRTVEFEARYDGAQIDRAVVNAERIAKFVSLPPSRSPDGNQERNFLRGVEMILHQANRGPAKAKGATGDKGVIETVSDKPLPVYFAEGVNKLKDRMVRGTKNPLKYVYNVDVWVHRDEGLVKAYTVTDVHQASALIASKKAKK